MKRFQRLLWRHPLLHWLVLVGMSFLVYAGLESLLGRPDWVWIVGMSLCVPTVMIVLSRISRDPN